MSVERDAIVLRRPARAPREGWAEDAKALVEAGEGGLVWPEFAASARRSPSEERYVVPAAIRRRTAASSESRGPSSDQASSTIRRLVLPRKVAIADVCELRPHQAALTGLDESFRVFGPALAGRASRPA